MSQFSTDKNRRDASRDVWFVYDGDCPICQIAARALRIKQAVGALNLIDARTNAHHEVVQEIKERGLNLDEGMVIKFNNHFYHGADALQIMALLGTGQGWFNKMNYWLFRSSAVARFAYPVMRAARNLALAVKGTHKINNLCDRDIPIFQPVFGEDWQHLPPVMRKHYANRPYSNDISTVEGVLDVMCAWYLQPFLRLLGIVPAYNEKNVPVTVHFTSEPHNAGFGFLRVFHFKKHKTFHFRSHMYQVKGSEVVEHLGYGIGWHAHYSWDGEKVVLAHKGYSLRICGITLPLPISWLIGRSDAYEIPLDDNSFAMCVTITHPLLGVVYEYKGQFKVVGA